MKKPTQTERALNDFLNQFAKNAVLESKIVQQLDKKTETKKDEPIKRTG